VKIENCLSRAEFPVERKEGMGFLPCSSLKYGDSKNNIKFG